MQNQVGIQTPRTQLQEHVGSAVQSLPAPERCWRLPSVLSNQSCLPGREREWRPSIAGVHEGPSPEELGVGEGKMLSSEDEVISPKAGEGLGHPGSLSHSPAVTAFSSCSLFCKHSPNYIADISCWGARRGQNISC